MFTLRMVETGCRKPANQDADNGQLTEREAHSALVALLRAEDNPFLNPLLAELQTAPPGGLAGFTAPGYQVRCVTTSRDFFITRISPGVIHRYLGRFELGPDGQWRATITSVEEIDKAEKNSPVRPH
jgi:hypothetical protein